MFFRRNDGQDLAEYCLLLGLIGLIALGFIVKAMGGIQGIWSSANSGLATANATVSGNSAATASGTGGGDQGGGDHGGGDHGGGDHGDGR